MTAARALTAAVVAEQQAVYGYGVAGAHLAGRDRADALRALDGHRLRRDRLAALLTGAGGRAPTAAPAYALPFPVTEATAARSLCADLEDACAAAAWDLVQAASARSAARAVAVGWLAHSAIAAAGWRGGSDLPALPGQPR